jgi:peptidoglycan/xylan/chitin deacetylase (PgdA/CDA1 family)
VNPIAGTAIDHGQTGVRICSDEAITDLLRAAGFARWNARYNRVGGRRRAAIVMYHSFTPGGWAAVAPGSLRWQLELMRDAYEVVPLARLVAALANGEPTEGLVAVTVDDAYEDFFTVAYPMLRELGLPATLFVPTGLVGAHSDWYDEARAPLKIAGSSMLGELDPDLVTLGSHTVHHRRLGGLVAEALETELSGSKRYLETLTGRPVTLLAYPFGGRASYTADTLRAARAAGFVAAVTTRWATYSSERELMSLPRISFREGDGPAQVRAKLAGDFDWLNGRELAAHLVRSTFARRR